MRFFFDFCRSHTPSSGAVEAAVVVVVVASRVVGTATSRPCLPRLTFDVPQNGFLLIQDHFQLIDFVLNVVLTSLGDVLLL